MVEAGDFFKEIHMPKQKTYKTYTSKALETLSGIMEYSEDEKIRISAAKELLNITAVKNMKESDPSEPVIFKGEVR